MKNTNRIIPFKRYAVHSYNIKTGYNDLRLTNFPKSWLSKVKSMASKGLMPRNSVKPYGDVNDIYFEVFERQQAIRTISITDVDTIINSDSYEFDDPNVIFEVEVA